jgi:hypothetical protein
MTTRVMVVGMGPIGARIAGQLVRRKAFRLVGAVDLDPAKVGLDVAELAGLPAKTRVRVAFDLDAVIRRTKPQVAVLCTGSSLVAVRPQLERLLARRVPVVSTTEELAYPWFSNQRLARRIDAAARKARVAVVATGVNPGFAMDALPIALCAVCERVDRVRVDRVQDARIRRLPFQKKIGAGLSAGAFAERVRGGTVRHVGLTESIAMIADAFGWKLDRVTDEIQPKFAEAAIEALPRQTGELAGAGALRVETGQVCGIVQEGIGFRGDTPAIVLHMEAYLGAPETFDQVTIEGSPRLCVRAAGGYHGDVATASIVVNTIPKLLAAAPGLHSMRSLALPSFAG